MSNPASSLWVGEYSDTGTLLVYDPVLQISEEDQVIVFSLTAKALRKYVRQELRRKITNVSDGSRRAYALSEYSKWREAADPSHLKQAYLDGLPEFGSSKGVVQDRHEQFLKARGLANFGARSRIGSDHRSANCWRCRSSVNNSINLECGGCGWIICQCGACGCGQ